MVSSREVKLEGFESVVACSHFLLPHGENLVKKDTGETTVQTDAEGVQMGTAIKAYSSSSWLHRRLYYRLPGRSLQLNSGQWP